MARISSYITVLFVVSVLAGLSCSYDREIVIVENGVPRMGLVLPENPTSDERLAEEELRAFVQRMSGGVLESVGPGSEGPKFFLGRADAFDAAEFPDQIRDAASDLEPEAYLRVAVGSDLYLLGGSGRGALWAVYGLLHEFGCRWYMPAPDGEVVPRRATLAISGKPIIENPDFPFRQVWYTWGRAEVTGPEFHTWKRRNRLAHPQVMHGHNLKPSLPESASFERRPELYALVSGERADTQVCTTNPEVVRLITETVNGYFDRYPDALCYSLCPDDNDDFCECDNCTALDTGAFDIDRQKPVVSDRYVTFMNQVAEGIQERHPGKMVSMYAYINHSTPPENVEVSPHVVIFFTGSVYCGGHGIGDTLCESRMKMRADLEAWCEACPNVYIYEYDPVPGSLELPWPLFGARTREMPVYRELGIQGLSMESHCSWATLSPNHWVTAQCLWSADRTKEELLRDFCAGFFEAMATKEDAELAEVSDSMFDYYTVLEGALAQHEPKLEWGQRDIPFIYTAKRTAACRAALDKALAAAKRCSHPEAPVIRRRLDMIDIGFRYLESYLEFRRLDRDGGTLDALQASFEQCTNLVDQMIATRPDWIERESVLPDLTKMLSPLIDERFSSEFGLVTDWLAIGPFDSPAGTGHDHAYPPEREIDLDATYEGAKGKVAWKKISAGEGHGYMNLLHHFEPVDWVTVYAMGYLHAERDMDVQIRVGSNDTLKMWLGGELVWTYDDERGAVVDDDVVPVQVKAGKTPVLLKVSQTGNDWGFYFRITDMEGNPASGVTMELRP